MFDSLRYPAEAAVHCHATRTISRPSSAPLAEAVVVFDRYVAKRMNARCTPRLQCGRRREWLLSMSWALALKLRLSTQDAVRPEAAAWHCAWVE